MRRIPPVGMLKLSRDRFKHVSVDITVAAFYCILFLRILFWLIKISMYLINLYVWSSERYFIMHLFSTFNRIDNFVHQCNEKVDV